MWKQCGIGPTFNCCDPDYRRYYYYSYYDSYSSHYYYSYYPSYYYYYYYWCVPRILTSAVFIVKFCCTYIGQSGFYISTLYGDSVVSIAAPYGLDGPGIESR